MTWELGGGLGHMMQLAPLASELASRGHRVIAALRGLSRARAVFRDQRIILLQAPVKIRMLENQLIKPLTFAHILHNICFSDEAELATMTSAWRHLYEMIDPDMIVFDYSPTALLAARGRPVKKALLGHGFFCPRDEQPLPKLSPSIAADSQRLLEDEMRILQTMNRVLSSWGEPAVERVTQMYSEVDENLLTTFPELDHYRARSSTRYWGPLIAMEGESPPWSPGKGARIYAYLKPFPALLPLLQFLNGLRQPTLISADGIHPDIRQQFSSATVQFAEKNLDLGQVGKTCDLAILHGTHGTTAAMLLAGRPVLQIPIFLEQEMFARVITSLGAGLEVSQQDARQIAQAVNTIMHAKTHLQKAQEFAEKYRAFDSKEQMQSMIERMEELAALQ